MVAFFSSIKLTVKNSIFFFGENKFRKKGENCMKKILSLILFVLIVSSVFALYHPGDIVSDVVFEDIVWDSDGNPSFTEHSLADLVEEGKAIVIYYFEISYS